MCNVWTVAGREQDGLEGQKTCWIIKNIKMTKCLFTLAALTG